MTRQGYLILHEKRHAPRIYYFSLEDGILRYFLSAKRAKAIGEVRLSGCKIAVKAQKRNDGLPYSFYLETRKVFVKDRSYTLGGPVRLELSAHSNEDRQEWGKALFSWQRYYWRDPSTGDDADAGKEQELVRAQLERILQEVACQKDAQGAHSYCGTKGPASATNLAFSVAKQPLTFLRRNASTLRRSLSLYMPSTTSTTSTTSSSSAVTTPSKSKTEAAGPEVTVSAKVCLAGVSLNGGEPLDRGDNQVESLA